MSGIKSYLIDVLAKLIVTLVKEVPPHSPHLLPSPPSTTPSTTPYILRMEFGNDEYITLSAVVQRTGCFLYVTYPLLDARTSSEQVRVFAVVPDLHHRTYDESGTLHSQWLAEHAFDLAKDMVRHLTFFHIIEFNVRTGRSFPFAPSHFTGAGSKLKFKNGITYDDLENTANSGSRQKDPLVYAHTSMLGNAGGARINTGRDPTRTLAPLSSWRLVPGQRHPTLGDPQNPAARFQYGLSDLRKIPQEQLHAALAGERKRQEEERARKESTRELGKRKRNQS